MIVIKEVGQMQKMNFEIAFYKKQTEHNPQLIF